MSMKSAGVTDVTGHTYNTVTRAHTRAYGTHRGEPVTSVTPVTPDSAPASGSDALPHAILALDLGTTTGWALHAPDGMITSGSVSFRPSRYDGGGMRYLRFQPRRQQRGRRDCDPALGSGNPRRRAMRAREILEHAARVVDDRRAVYAAICDDELVQAIGHGRGVNRTACCPASLDRLRIGDQRGRDRGCRSVGYAQVCVHPRKHINLSMPCGL